jgi:hypothetical protein
MVKRTVSVTGPEERKVFDAGRQKLERISCFHCKKRKKSKNESSKQLSMFKMEKKFQTLKAQKQFHSQNTQERN